MFPSQEEVRRIRERFPVGTKIVLDHMGNDPHPIPDGTKGVVKHVDDAGTLHCVFENGRSLGIIPGEDSFHVVKEKTLQEILASIDQTRDAFWVFPEERIAFEAYYNPDCNAGGQFVFTSFSFKTIMQAEEYADGNTDESDPTCLSGAKGQDATVLRIDSSRGTVFKNNAVATVLSAVIYHGSQRITDINALRAAFGASAYLQWKWQRLNDSAYGTISASDSRLSQDGFCFTLSPEDVDVKVTFMCELITD